MLKIWGKNFPPFWIKMTPKLQTQRPTKVPTPYREKLKTSLDDLQKYGTLKQIGSSLHKKSSSVFESNDHHREGCFF